MADPVFRYPSGVPVIRSGAPWGAIWAGVFSFMAIWSVFGLLGAAIFSSAGNMAHPSTGIGWGMGIWSVVLTMIAMFVGGRVTARLSGAWTRSEGAIAGMTMFGLAVVSTLLIVVLTGAASGNAAAAGAPYLIGVISPVGWFGWFALLLGWLCAMGGAAGTAAPQAERQFDAPVHDIRSAA